MLQAEKINSRLSDLVEAKQLYCFETLAGGPPIRKLFVSPEVRQSYFDAFPDDKIERHVGFISLLESFVEGHMFTVCEVPDYQKGPTMLARTNPINMEVWDLRRTDEPPGIRCAGCFAAQNMFVALVWDYREDIPVFDDFVRDCRIEWDRLFYPLSPFSGSSVNAYITNVELVVPPSQGRKNS